MNAAAAPIDTTPGEWDHLSFRLGEEFVQSYAERRPPWGFPIGGGNSLGEITWFTKYARTKADGTKERWHEGCRRVVEGTYSILKDHCQSHRTPWNAAKAARAAEDMYDRLWSMKWTPPGRGLWMMGTPFIFEEGSAALQNCFTAEQKIITRQGVMALGDIVGSEVEVWTHQGWEKAAIEEFGTQPVQSVTFGPASNPVRGDHKLLRSNHRVSMTVTPDHRWLLSKGGETTSLAVGDVVPAACVEADPLSDDWRTGAAHGLVFGDGNKITHRYSNGDFGFELRVCDQRTLRFMEEHGLVEMFDRENLTRPSANGDPIYFKRTSVDLKEFPVGPSSNYAAGFLSGWLCADGSTSPFPSARKLCSQHPGAEAWLNENAAYAGYVVTGNNVDNVTHTNYGPRSGVMRRFTLAEARHWKVTSIEALPVPQKVFCAVVPSVGSFTLAEGIYTGNCAFLSTEKLGLRNPTLPFVRLMEMSMLGIGVGFDTRGAGKLDVHKPSDTTTTYRIPDSREGWCESVNLLLRSYLLPGQAAVEFIYDDIRPAGEPIKRFGGVAAGPVPLKRLHTEVRRLLDAAEGQSLSSTLIVDIGNMIGKCVVAGNVRRSAEIALGFPDDKAFLQLKDWEVNPDRNGMDGWGHLSNNSVMATVGMDLDHLAQQVVHKGEPGVLYIDLMRSHGRLADPPNNKDWRAAGCNPCAEQTLEDNECCTLVETYPTNCEDFEDYRRTLKVAYLYAKAVTLLPTHWPESNEVMSRNRRIGASGTGLAMFAERNGWTMLRNWMDQGYEEVTSRDRQYSEWLGVRESIKTTSIKPSGTVSLLAGVTPGVHWPVAGERYFRRVRYSIMDPIVPVLQEAGYHVEPSEADPEADVVVTFPTIGPPVRSEREVSVWEKVNLAALAQKHWADNMVSATFTFTPDEEKEIPAILRAMDGQMKSMSFLPMGEAPAYPQMPYEKVPDEDFDALLSGIKPLDMEALYATDREADGEKFCNNDVCEIPSR